MLPCSNCMAIGVGHVVALMLPLHSDSSPYNGSSPTMTPPTSVKWTKYLQCFCDFCSVTVDRKVGGGWLQQVYDRQEDGRGLSAPPRQTLCIPRFQGIKPTTVLVTCSPAPGAAQDIFSIFHPPLDPRPHSPPPHGPPLGPGAWLPEPLITCSSGLSSENKESH